MVGEDGGVASKGSGRRVMLPPIETRVVADDTGEGEGNDEEDTDVAGGAQWASDDAQRRSMIRRELRDDKSSKLSDAATVEADDFSSDEDEEEEEEEDFEPDVDLKFNIRAALKESSKITQGYAWAFGYLVYIVFNCALLMLQSDVPRSFEVYRTLQNALKFGSGSMRAQPADLSDVPGWLDASVLTKTFTDPVCGDGTCTAPYEFAAFAEAGCLADCGLEVRMKGEEGGWVCVESRVVFLFFFFFVVRRPAPSPPPASFGHFFKKKRKKETDKQQDRLTTAGVESLPAGQGAAGDGEAARGLPGAGRGGPARRGDVEPVPEGLGDIRCVRVEGEPKVRRDGGGDHQRRERCGG